MKNILKTNKILLYALAVALIINIFALGFYTFIINNKINEALDIIKPQSAKLIYISEKSCEKCRNLDALKKYVTAQNIEITDQENLSTDQKEAQKFIDEYKITKLPVLIFIADEKIKTPLKKTFEESGNFVSDTVIVWEQIFPPFHSLLSDKTEGLVDLIYLSDKRCENCYDPAEIFDAVLKSFGIQLNDLNIIDVSDSQGAELITKYNIENIPTVILSKEVALYEQFDAAWKEVGTVEEDGHYVFRNIDKIQQTYKNLKSGAIIVP